MRHRRKKTPLPLDKLNHISRYMNNEIVNQDGKRGSFRATVLVDKTSNVAIAADTPTIYSASPADGKTATSASCCACSGETGALCPLRGLLRVDSLLGGRVSCSLSRRFSSCLGVLPMSTAATEKDIREYLTTGVDGKPGIPAGRTGRVAAQIGHHRAHSDHTVK